MPGCLVLAGKSGSWSRRMPPKASGGDPARMPTSNAVKKYPLPAAKGLPQAFQRPKGAAALCHQFETTILQAL